MDSVNEEERMWLAYGAEDGGATQRNNDGLLAERRLVLPGKYWRARLIISFFLV